ncbi:MAG TPA: L-seryl-tRNA(Sec) selenium transferase [Acidobacteriota bacterium]|nr:L-seryl-tRNA(Sec) selenium transferase [Acidobacteriota bacterium]
MIKQQVLQQLPSIDSILQRQGVRSLVEEYSRELVIEHARQWVEELRTQALGGEMDAGQLAQRSAGVEDDLARSLRLRLRPSLRRVINASGVILHTNVGRAPIAPFVAEWMGKLAGSYSNLEYNLETGRRGQRDQHFEARLTRLLGCQAASVTNNNAAALFLILNTLARGKQVLVSRGELIEIGGSFRLPSIMEASGALLREVGTTNKTRISDYRQAMGEETALIMRVHPSNYKVVGFTQAPELQELAELSKESGIPLAEDIGSGYLFPTGHPALEQEPTAQMAIDLGVDLVCFSGDKLLGGPQAGIVAGRQDLVNRLRKNPLMRACRIDKTTYAALERVLIEYETGRWQETLPIYQMLSLTAGELERRAQELGERLAEKAGQYVRWKVVDGESLVGGGSAPGQRLPSRLLSLQTSSSPSAVEERLRRHQPPVLVRIERDRLLIDLRTVFPQEQDDLMRALQWALQDRSLDPVKRA